MSPRIGFFHVFQKQEMIVRKYDVETEVLSSEGAFSSHLITT